MPELPEVETIKSQLENALKGKKIASVEIFFDKIVKSPPDDFKKAITGLKIKKIRRRAKVLIFDLDPWSFLVHLKLTGQLIINGKKNKHTHVIFRFSDGTSLIFNDLRKFGYIKLVRTDEVEKFLEKENFGPEPLTKGFDIKKFKEILAARPKMKIKQFLMDPKNIAGIGNIYSDEILFMAEVNPLRPGNTLSNKEIKVIFTAIKKVLPEAIKYKGTSAENYLDARGKEGKFLPRLKVYGREGEKCIKCNGEIKRIKLGGRSAHFCPACQA